MKQPTTDHRRQEIWSRFEPQFRGGLLLIALYAIPTRLSLIPSTIVQHDMWWHLRTGQWIQAHKWVPYHDWFSSYGMGKFWAAYSWLFEVVLADFFSQFDLAGVLLYVFVLMVSITTAVFLLVRKCDCRLALAVALTAIVILALSPMVSPRPWLFTILLFTVELTVIVEAKRSRNYRVLFLLPLIFGLWANVHIQFIYGLFVLFLATLEGPLTRLIGRFVQVEIDGPPLPMSRLGVITVASIVATFINPYHIRIYSVLLDTVRLTGLYDQITELQALGFRSFPDWLLLSLTLGAVFVTGRRRRIDILMSLLLMLGIFLSFRSKRDAWFVAIVAIIIISRSFAAVSESRANPLLRGDLLLVSIAIILTSGSAFVIARGSNEALAREVSANFPVGAVQFIRDHNFDGPLYNSFDWGGYLIWKLPNLPVSIDGRSNIHDADRIRSMVRTWEGAHDWSSDPELSTARLVVAPRDKPLTQLLRLDSRFVSVYEDNVAVVFVRH
ncbi:MAG TPA: hypothetical protein VGQ41_17090 [Pyrinomonadaceae bacterium]|nr:hypothetical protein [Pyrinomonadaceae bacterium]